MDYTILEGKDREMVIARLKRKTIMDTGVFNEAKYDELCEKYLTDSMKDHYIIRTRGHITASKLKTFMKNPEEYYLKYVLELPELVKKDGKHFSMGNAFDCLMSYGMEGFDKKYYIEKGYVIDDLAKLIAARDGGYATDRSKKKLSELREIRYKAGDKIRLTPAEGRDVMGMYYEAMRQQMFRFRDEGYEKQVYVETTYENLIISGTFDRYHRGKKEIRDSKTVGRIETIEYDIENTFDYVTSMAFYYLLGYVNDGFESDVYLDMVGSSAPYQSMIYRLTGEKLRRKISSQLKPALTALSNALHGDGHFMDIIQRDNIIQLPRNEIMESPYYPILSASNITQCIDCN